MNIQNLSNSELERNLLSLVGEERKVLHLILLHIKEVDSRRLYLEKGRNSLFEYMVSDLGYSSSSAQRRIEGARLIREIPEISEKIKEGSLHLSQIGEFVRAIRQKESEARVKITSAQKLSLITSIECKSGGETQKILSSSLDLNLKPVEIKFVQKDESVHLSLTFSKELHVKIQRCREISSHKLLRETSGDFSAVIEILADYFLNKEDAPHEPKKATEPTESEQPRSKKPMKSTPAAAVEIQANETLTPKTRRLVKQLHRYCQYVNPQTQRQCRSRFLLEIDHKVPRWAGGTNEISNLTLLCAAHNKVKYRRESGLS
jgi:hypothetical protein